MKILSVTALLLLGFTLTRAICADETAANLKGNEAVVPASPSMATNRATYAVRAGGAHSFVTITNAPSSNRVAIAFATSTDNGAIFRITNKEPHAILLWNVRVQTRSRDAGTDGFGWDTVYDDYPMGTANYSSGGTGEFRVQYPGKTPWRVCILYSTDWTDSGKSCSGNYEVIGQELKE